MDKPNYQWDEDFQREIIGLLLSDKYFICQSLGLIESYYFSNEIHQQISKIVFRYFEEYKQLPTKMFIKEEMLNFLHSRYSDDKFDTLKLMYNAELNLIYDFFSKKNPSILLDSTEAILDKILNFSRFQATKAAISQCIEIVKQNPNADESYIKAQDIWQKSQLIQRKQDLGLDYFQTIDERYDRIIEGIDNQNVTTSGFFTIDNALNANGLRFGEIGGLMGDAGAGKSLIMVHICIKNMSQGRKVLYVTTEMDQDAVATRFDSMISCVGKHELMIKRSIVKNSIIEYIGSYGDKQRLFVKQFPSGTADLNTIKAFHAQLKMVGFKPDLVIIDYLGDLRDIPGMKTYESRYIMLRDLRGFGGVEGHATLTAIHPNRSASKKTIDEVLDAGDMSDSYHMFRVFDCLWTLNQTNVEKAACVGRVDINKHRDGRSKIGFKIHYGYQDQTLRISEISDIVYRNKMSTISSKIASLVGGELERPKNWKQKNVKEEDDL